MYKLYLWYHVHVYTLYMYILYTPIQYLSHDSNIHVPVMYLYEWELKCIYTNHTTVWHSLFVYFVNQSIH